jgi:hypothetical protein
MTVAVEDRKETVETTFKSYLDQLYTYAEQEHMGFIETTFGADKLDAVTSDMERQAEIVIEAAADYGTADADPSAYHDAFLRSNPFYTHYAGSRERALRRDLLTHFDTVVEDAAPLFTADTGDGSFETLMREAYDTRSEAADMLEENLTYAEQFEAYASDMYIVDAGRLNVLNPTSFERTVIPKIRDAQDWLWDAVITDDLDAIYGDDAAPR